MELVVVYAAPIPVGHRIEVSWHQGPPTGFFGGTRSELTHQPHIRDLETGVEYETDMVLGHLNAKRQDQPLDVGKAPSPDRATTRTGRFRVVRCRVVTIRDFATYDVQTHLTLEPLGG